MRTSTCMSSIEDAVGWVALRRLVGLDLRPVLLLVVVSEVPVPLTPGAPWPFVFIFAV